MALFAMAIPILPGKEEEWKKNASQLMTTWSAQFKASRKNLGVRERTFLQHTPHGDVVIVTLEGENPGAAFGGMFMVEDEFTNWMKGWVESVHGFKMDPSQPPPPMPELIIDSGA